MRKVNYMRWIRSAIPALIACMINTSHLSAQNSDCREIKREYVRLAVHYEVAVFQRDSLMVKNQLLQSENSNLNIRLDDEGRDKWLFGFGGIGIGLVIGLIFGKL